MPTSAHLTAARAATGAQWVRRPLPPGPGGPGGFAGRAAPTGGSAAPEAR